MDTLIDEPVLTGLSIADRWQHITNQPIQTHRVVENDRETRYVWYPGEDIPWHIDELPGGFVERCRVTPILPKPVWKAIVDVPETMRIDVRADPVSGKIDEARYEILPGPIFKSIMEKYESWGLVELRALKGFSLTQFMALQIDAIFAPWPKDRSSIDPVTGKMLDRCPRAYSDLKTHITQVAEGIKATGQVEISGVRFTLDPQKAQLYLAIANDMLLGIQRSEAFDVALVDSEETGDKPQYTVHGLRCLDRLGRRRRDHALADMARTENKVYGMLPELLAQQQQANTEGVAALASAIGESIARSFAGLIPQIQQPAIPAAPPEGESDQPPAPRSKPKNSNN